MPRASCWATTASIAGRVGGEHHRAHLGAEDTVLRRPLEQRVELRHRLHRLHAVRLVGQALVDLEERHHVLAGPQVLGRAQPLDLPVHRLLEQDGGQDALAREHRARHDPGAHRVDEVEHRGLVGVGRALDAVALQGLRRAAAALVEGGDEALAGADPVEHVVVHGASSPATPHRGRGGRPPASCSPASPSRRGRTRTCVTRRPARRLHRAPTERAAAPCGCCLHDPASALRPRRWNRRRTPWTTRPLQAPGPCCAPNSPLRLLPALWSCGSLCPGSGAAPGAERVQNGCRSAGWVSWPRGRGRAPRRGSARSG